MTDEERKMRLVMGLPVEDPPQEEPESSPELNEIRRAMGLPEYKKKEEISND